MVSDIVLVAIVGVAGTLLGAFFAEPIRAHFAHKAHQEQLRRALYSELSFKSYMVLRYVLQYDDAFKDNDIDYLKFVSKVLITTPVSFPDEVDARAQYYQLNSQDLELLAAAYHALRDAINILYNLASASFDNIEEAKKEHVVLKRSLGFAFAAINRAFKDNAHVLEKIDKGLLLKDWRELVQVARKDTVLQEYLTPNYQKDAAEKKKRLLLRH